MLKYPVGGISPFNRYVRFGVMPPGFRFSGIA